MPRMMNTPYLVENEDGTYSPVNPRLIKFRVSTDTDGYVRVELLLGETPVTIEKGMSTEEGALELLDAYLANFTDA